MPTVGLFAIGDLSAGLLDRLAACLEERFLLKFLVEAPFPVPTAAYNAGKKQYFAPTILRKMKIAPTSRLQYAVGITEVDLYGADANFLYGTVHQTERIALVSSYRLRPEYYGHPPAPPLQFGRLQKEIMNQLVRCMGGKNCYNRTCVMSSTKNIYEIDTKSSLFCYDCERRVQFLIAAEQRSSESR